MLSALHPRLWEPLAEQNPAPLPPDASWGGLGAFLEDFSMSKDLVLWLNHLLQAAEADLAKSLTTRRQREEDLRGVNFWIQVHTEKISWLQDAIAAASAELAAVSDSPLEVKQ